VVITVRSITLPFVCPKCEQAIAEFDNIDEETPKYDTAPAAVKLSEDFATVENTTLLIEDLERQLENQWHEIDALVCHILSQDNRSIWSIIRERIF
jgi:hypothetical protein